MAAAQRDYEQDFYAWTLRNAELLRQGRFSEIDVEHLAEELEDMGKSERRALESHLRTVVLHLLKWRFQPALRGASWRQSVRNGRIAIRNILRDSPSLARQLPEMLTDEYPAARADAADETGLGEPAFPKVCPFTLEQVLDADFRPEA